MLKDYRCHYCNKLFFKGALKSAEIEVKCRNCKQFNLFHNKDCSLLFLADNRETYQRAKPSSLDTLQCVSTDCEKCSLNNNCGLYQKMSEGDCPFCGREMK